MATTSPEKFAQRATRYCDNLDGFVDRHDGSVLYGGHARVYEGTLRPKGIKVAVKTINLGVQNDAVIEQVLREVHLWSKLHHDNILPLLGIVTQFDSTISIVSEWMHKGNAYQHVQNTDIDPRPLLQEIARGLNYLHGHRPHPVYHGDLKGLNVLISNDDHALLTDFGLSYIVNSSFSLQPDSRGGGGTVNWMAPEALDGAVISPEGDIWAFGMTILELFTRHYPFSEISSLGPLLARIVGGQFDRPSDESTCFRLSDEWWELCSMCWKRKPVDRPNISYVVQKIDQIMKEPARSGEPTGEKRAQMTEGAQQRHTLQTIPFVSDSRIDAKCGRTTRSGICSGRGYRGALTGAITTLKLARSVAEFFRIVCLEGVIVPSLSIAQSIEAIPGTHHALFRVVENAGILIGVISDHAQTRHLTPEMTIAIGMFAKELERVQGVVQSAERKTPSIRDTLRDADSRAISFCTNSMRRVCDAMEPMLSVENRQTLQRIDTGLVAMMRALEVYRCRCGVRKVTKQVTT